MPLITSSSTHWTGTVKIFDQFTLPQVEAVEEALQPIPNLEEDKKVSLTILDKPKLPAILLCVEEWHLTTAKADKPAFPEKPSIDNFPMSPRKASHDLIQWIFDEIFKVYLGEKEVPNE